MHWHPLSTETQLEQLIDASVERPQVIFKHSTRCSISSMAKNRLERNYEPSDIDFHFLDVLAHRSLSHAVAEKFRVTHESPQILLVKNGRCVYDESHTGIDMSEIAEQSKTSLG